MLFKYLGNLNGFRCIHFKTILDEHFAVQIQFIQDAAMQRYIYGPLKIKNWLWHIGLNKMHFKDVYIILFGHPLTNVIFRQRTVFQRTENNNVLTEIFSWAE